MITIDGYSIDVALSEDHSYETEVTKYPIEGGSKISDHAQTQPLKVTLECVVSDSPLNDLILERLNAGDKLPGANFGTLPSVDALNKLLDVQNAKEPVTIESSLKRFDNMLMTSFQIPKSRTTGEALHFTATFEEVVIISNERVNVAVPRSIVGGGGRSKLGSKLTPITAYDKAYPNPQRGVPVFTIRQEFTTRNPVTGETNKIVSSRNSFGGMANLVCWTEHVATGVRSDHYKADKSNPKFPPADGMVVSNPLGRKKTRQDFNPGTTNTDPGDVDSVDYSPGLTYYYVPFGFDEFDRQTGAWRRVSDGEPLQYINKQGKPATMLDAATGNLWRPGDTENMARPGGFVEGVAP